MPQEAANITTYITLEAETCCNCGMAFGIASDFRRRLLNEKRGQSFYCPAGHSQHYTEKSEAERLREKIAAKDAEIERERARTLHAQQETERKERQRRYVKGQLTKAKKRVAAGVCPVADCHRHFENLGRHMTTKHPDFAGQDIG